MENVKLVNRAACSIGYKAYTGQTRSFRPAGQVGDTMMVPKEEVVQLNYTKGGADLLANYLFVEKEVLEDLQIETEIEYEFTAEDVARSLKEDSLEELREHLEYAPEGVRSLYIKIAVDTKLDSVEKRELIQEVLGFNVNGAINLEKSIETPVEDKKAEKPTTARRSAPRTRASKK